MALLRLCMAFLGHIFDLQLQSALKGHSTTCQNRIGPINSFFHLDACKKFVNHISKTCDETQWRRHSFVAKSNSKHRTVSYLWNAWDLHNMLITSTLNVWRRTLCATCTNERCRNIDKPNFSPSLFLYHAPIQLIHQKYALFLS